MRTFFNTKFRIFNIFQRALFLLLPFFFLNLAACSKNVRYDDYVSELRQNIFLVESEEYYLRIYAVEKESPYSADGVPRETSPRTEIYLVAPEGDKECHISFTVGEKTYSGEMSYDNARGEYYYYCTLDVSKCNALPCKIKYGDTEFAMNALSVLNGNELPPKKILKNVQNENAELFASLTDKYGFKGEIYMRLIYEDAPYYYVGIIDRDGNIYAFLANATSGKILAKRQP